MKFMKKLSQVIRVEVFFFFFRYMDSKYFSLLFYIGKLTINLLEVVELQEQTIKNCHYELSNIQIKPIKINSR